MPRPRKWRKVCCLPQSSRFGPADGTPSLPEVHMTVDEYEAMRLIDLEGLTQEACAAQMGIARTTVQRIYNSARQKTADAVVGGRLLIIHGGDFQLCDGRRAACCQYGGCRCLKCRQESGPK